MKLIAPLFLILLFTACQSPTPVTDCDKPRVVILTDVSFHETDDSESMVRLMAHADLLEIEGIVLTTGWNIVDNVERYQELIDAPIDAYAKDVENLMKRSAQTAFAADEERQKIGYWPSAEYLRERAVVGSNCRGIANIGKGNDSDGSRLIIRLVDEADERPLWICAWGGANTLAQAIWRVQQERSEDELEDFLEKLRLYTITDQDVDINDFRIKKDYRFSSHFWMRQEFEEDLMILWDESAWKRQNGIGKHNWAEAERLIQPKGALGKVYPKYKFGVEGDSPSMFYLFPVGLSDPDEPTNGSWGGYFRRGVCMDSTTVAYTNWNSVDNPISERYERYFYPAIFNNFAARMEWADKGEGNRNPIVVVNGEGGLDVIEVDACEGDEVVLDATGSSDPDGDTLSYRWWMLAEAGDYSGKIIVKQDQTATASFIMPEGDYDEIHMICEVTDGGTPALTSYRRVIVELDD